MRAAVLLPALMATAAWGVTLTNPGFESDFSGWTDTDPSAISTSDVHSGSKAAKITGSGGRVEQDVTVTANTDYVLKAWVYQHGTIGADVGGTAHEQAGDYESGFTQVEVDFNSGSNTTVTIYCAYNGGTGRFDDFTLAEATGTSAIWQEDFDLTDGTTSDTGSSAWTLDTTNLKSTGDLSVENGKLSGNNTGGEVVWESESIDISGASSVSISADIDGAGALDPDDYIDLAYSVDGGSVTTWSHNADDLSPVNVSTSGISGSSLVLYAYIKNSASDEYYNLDSISVTADSGGSNSVPVITTASLPDGTVGDSYSQTLSATGGDGTLTWSISSGSLPAGLSLSSGGVISGTPTSAVNATFQVQVADADSPPDTDTEDYTLDVGSAPPSGTVDFNSVSTTAYGSNGPQDGSGTVSVQDSGATLVLTGNRWRDIPFSYTVDADTVLQFDFKSTDEAEMHCIGFDDDDNQDNTQRAFEFYGTQDWSNKYALTTYGGSGNWTTYTVHVGNYYTGTFDRLFFINDGDSNTGNSYFRNVQVYEDTSGGGSTLPSDVLDLTNWKLTIPFDSSGNDGPTHVAAEITQPALDSYELPGYFEVNSAGDAVDFKAHAGGATTSGSGYPRCELREMTNSGADQASWSSDDGVTHTMHIRQAVLHLPAVKDHVVLGQIHDSSDDITVFRLEGTKLYVTDGNSKITPAIDTNFQLGVAHDFDMVVENDHIYMYYDNTLVATLSEHISGCYFKAGCYTQSSCGGSKQVSGEDCDAYGQVEIYELSVTHN